MGAVSSQWFERLHIEKKKWSLIQLEHGYSDLNLRPISVKNKTNIYADEPQVLLHKALEGFPWKCSQFYAVLLPLSTCTSHSCVLFCSYSDWAFWMSVKYNLEFRWFHCRIH